MDFNAPVCQGRCSHPLCISRSTDCAHGASPHRADEPPEQAELVRIDTARWPTWYRAAEARALMRPVNPLAPTTDQAGEHDRSLMGPLYLGSLKYCPTIAQGKLLVKIALVGSTAEASRSRSVCREQGLWTSGWTENVRIKAPCKNPGGSVALPFSSCPSHSFLSALLHFSRANEAYP